MTQKSVIFITGIIAIIIPAYIYSAGSMPVYAALNDFSQTGKTSGMRRNNPLNMRPGSTGGSQYAGVTGQSGNFLIFATWENGLAAAIQLLRRYVTIGVNSSCVGKPQNTVRKIISAWSPKASCGGDNTDQSTENYISFVSERTGFNQNSPIDIHNKKHLFGLVSAMARMEHGVECVTLVQFQAAWKIAEKTS